MRVDFGTADAIPEGRGKCITHDGKRYALFRLGADVHCLDNTCTHMGGPLCEGRVQGSIVQCPWHGSRFDVRTGQVVGPPARVPVRSHAVTVESGRVWVELP